MIEQSSLNNKESIKLSLELREDQLNILHLLFTSEFKTASEMLQEKIPIHLQLKKQKKGEVLNQQQLYQKFQSLSQRLHIKVSREGGQYQKILNKLQSQWQQLGIQIFHRYSFQKNIYTTYMSSIPILMKNEEHLIRMNQHIYFSILKVINARLACLNHLKREIKALSSSDIYEHFQTVRDRELQSKRKIQQRQYRVYGYKAKYVLDERQTKLQKTKMQIFSQDLNNYRLITCHLIQLIKSWKLYMQSLTHDAKVRKQRVQFYYENHNHLITMLNDNSFLCTSFLSSFYTFATKNDPFLLKPILNLQKQTELKQGTFQNIELKRIINCKLNEIPRIIQSLRELYTQVQWNIENKKYFEKNGLVKYRSVKLQKIEKSRSQIKLPSMSSVKLNKLVKQSSSKKDKFSQVDPTKTTSSFSKNNFLKRKPSLMNKLQKESSYKSRNMNIFNPQYDNRYKLLESKQWGSIKSQVFNKVKLDLDYQSKKNLMQSQLFSNLIQSQLRISLQHKLKEEQIQKIKNHLQVSTLSFEEDEISSFISLIYKDIPVAFRKMMSLEEDMHNLVHQLQYCFILKVHSSVENIGNVIASINREVTQYKSIKIDLITFRQVQNYQRIVLKIVQFFWKYENAKEIIFTLSYSDQQTSKFVKQIKRKLQINCNILDKRYSNHQQSKFIFINRSLEKIFYNPYPKMIHFKLCGVLAQKQVKLEHQIDNQMQSVLYYDLLVIQILRKHTNSEDLAVFRDNFRPKDRFRFLINQLIQIQQHKEYQIPIQTISTQNILQLNHSLRQSKQPTLQISDLVKDNKIMMLSMKYTLTIACKLKIVSTKLDQIYHRYENNQDIHSFKNSKGTQFLRLPLQESHHIKLVVFDASNYLQNGKKGLSSYLFEEFSHPKLSWQAKAIHHLWIPTLRYPQKYTQRQKYTLTSQRVKDFDIVGKDLILGDTFDWHTDIRIQNGIRFKIQKNDQLLKYPLGVAVITNKNWVLYCRIFSKQ